MKLCPDCQTERDDEERICPNCGSKPRPPGLFGKLLGLFRQKSATDYLDVAKDAFDRQNYSRTIQAYGKAFLLNPDLIPRYQDKLVLAHQYRADVSMRHRNARSAIEDYSQAIRLNPASVVSLYGRAVAFIRLSQFDLAIADLNEAIRLQPDYFPAYIGRAECYYKKGDLVSAIADDTEAIRIQPNYPAAYRGRGQLYSQRKDHDLAIADFTEAIRLDPQNPQSYVLRAREYRSVGDFLNAANDERTLKNLKR